MYFPMLSEARAVSRFQSGGWFALLVTDCSSPASIRYIHVLFVYQATFFPRYAVACESNAHFPESRILGAFPGDGHINMGHDPKWGDLDEFAPAATALAAKEL